MLLDKDAPDSWVDDEGRRWKTPRIRGRLKCGKVALHRRLREFVLRRDGYTCQHCGARPPVLLLADHIVSRRNGGSHHPDNLQCLCDHCNARKVGMVDRHGPPRPIGEPY